MDIFTLIKAGYKRKKSTFLGIFMLMFIISVTLATVLTIKLQSDSHDSKMIQKLGYGDIVVWTYPVNNIDEICRELEDNKNIDKVTYHKNIYFSYFTINNEKHDSNTFYQVYNPEDRPYTILNESCNGAEQSPSKLTSGEIYVPVSYIALYGCKKGDIISITIADIEYQFCVKGFFEDPLMGSSLMGIKTVLISQADLNELYAAAGEQTADSYNAGYELNLHQSDSSSLSFLKLEQDLNKITDFKLCCQNILGETQAEKYMTILSNIVTGILGAFLIILFLISLIVMENNISSSIEMEYTNLGILKSLGFSIGKLRFMQVMQYFLAAFAGMFFGIPTSIPIIKLINKLTVSATGLLLPGYIAIVPCFIGEIILLLFIGGFCFVNTGKIRKISPLCTINGGRQEVYFKSRMEIPISKKGLPFLLAFRQMVSGMKQYAGTVLITAFLMFFITLAAGLGTWIGKDGTGLKNLFLCYQADLEIFYQGDIQDEAEQYINSISQIEQQYQMYVGYLLLNGNECCCMSFSDENELNSLQEGRLCKYDNEIMITQSVADNLNMKIGDTVSVSYREVSANYIITGIYECADDTGINFVISFSGLKKLGLQESDCYNNYVIKNSRKAQAIADVLKERYQEKIEIDEGMGGIPTVTKAIKSVMYLIYVIAMLFVLIVVYLVCKKVFLREKQDIGIYKALGFSSGMLRRHFALRFAYTGFLGSLGGLILNFTFAKSCIRFFLVHLAGIHHQDSTVSLGVLCMPVVLMVLVFAVFSYLAAARIKKVEPRILISE